MSDDNAAPHLRIMPAAGTDEVPTPDETLLTAPLTGPDVVEIKDEEPDTGPLLDKIIDTRHFPAGAKVGDGTPGPGRKPFDIDERIVYAMALVGGTFAEIAAHFGCSDTTIQKRFGDVVRQGRASRKIRLRQKQYQVALDGNVGMLIWLGKQELGQIDERQVRVGDLARFSDDELRELAAGKVPGQLGAGAAADDDEE